MENTPPKRGRGNPKKHFIDASGKQIFGLARDAKSGRWRIIASNKFFREADETKAIEKFYAIQGKNNFDPQEQYYQQLKIQHHGFVDWQQVAKELNTRPLWVAEQTGVEWLAYGKTMKAPAPSPKLSTLGENFKANKEISADQHHKIMKHWKEFCDVTGAKELGDITPPLAGTYKSFIAKSLSKKSQKHRVGNIRRLLAWNKEQGTSIKEISEALQNLVVLKVRHSKTIPNPQPISVSDFHTILNAGDKFDKASCLLMLNCAVYAQELIRLKWDDFKDGCLSSMRLKTGEVLRVSTLWAETIEAMKHLPKTTEYLFLSRNGTPISRDGFDKRFIKLREAAKLPHITASMFRDGAASAMGRAKIGRDEQDIVMGHQSGIRDHYLMRDKEMVRNACNAIHAHYFESDEAKKVQAAIMSK